jgi:predicted Zn-dependent protease
VLRRSGAYLIEDSKITAPVRDATLIGNGPEALKYVSMEGHDLKLDDGIGTCGKDGQSVPVGVGMPTIKLDRMTVGDGAVTLANSLPWPDSISQNTIELGKETP